MYSIPYTRVDSNFNLAVHSPKFGQAKNHFFTHFGEKKSKNMARPGFEPMISRSEVDRARKLANLVTL